MINKMSIWQAENINNNKFIKYDDIKFEELIQNNNYVGGKLCQYINHSMESDIFLKIIKYIRKYKYRITIIGIDNDKIYRNYDMYKIIVYFLDPLNINFVWASNNHIGDFPLSDDDLLYIKNENHR